MHKIKLDIYLVGNTVFCFIEFYYSKRNIVYGYSRKLSALLSITLYIYIFLVLGSP